MARYVTPTELWRLARMGACSPSEFPDAGEISAVTKTGTGSGTMAASGYPIDAYTIRVLVSLAGELTSTVVPAPPLPRVRISLDGGVKYGQPLVVPKGGVLVIPLTGITLTFVGGAAPSFSLNDRWDFTTTESPEMVTAIEAASDEVDGYLKDTYSLPLLEPIPKDVKRHTASMARYHLMTNRGHSDAEKFRAAYDDSMKWLLLVANGSIQPNIKESGGFVFASFHKPRPAYRTTWRT